MVELRSTVTGTNEVIDAFKRAPREVQMRVYVKASSRGAAVIENALAATTPVREGDLFAAMTRELMLDADGRGVVVQVGFGKRGYIANFVEYGHRQLSHKFRNERIRVMISRIDKKTGLRKLKKAIRRTRAQQYLLGKVKPHPFMRPAAEASFDPVMEEVIDVVRTELVAAGLLSE